MIRYRRPAPPVLPELQALRAADGGCIAPLVTACGSCEDGGARPKDRLAATLHEGVRYRGHLLCPGHGYGWLRTHRALIDAWIEVADAAA